MRIAVGVELAAEDKVTALGTGILRPFGDGNLVEGAVLRVLKRTVRAGERDTDGGWTVVIVRPQAAFILDGDLDHRWECGINHRGGQE